MTDEMKLLMALCDYMGAEVEIEEFTPKGRRLDRLMSTDLLMNNERIGEFRVASYIKQTEVRGIPMTRIDCLIKEKEQKHYFSYKEADIGELTDFLERGIPEIEKQIKEWHNPYKLKPKGEI